MDDIEQDIRNTIRLWRNDGILAQQAWSAMGAKGECRSWVSVEARMIRLSHYGNYLRRSPYRKKSKIRPVAYPDFSISAVVERRVRQPVGQLAA